MFQAVIYYVKHLAMLENIKKKEFLIFNDK